VILSSSLGQGGNTTSGGASDKGNIAPYTKTAQVNFRQGFM